MKRADSYGGPKVSVEDHPPRPRQEGGSSQEERALEPHRADAKGAALPVEASHAGSAGHGKHHEPRFSPDPAATTDRYRLVTPFSLRF